jgi:uncharacterized cupin superfamily protein
MNKDVIIRQLSEKEKAELGISSWGIWEKEVSTFDWEYFGTEECLILEGEVVVSTDKGEYQIKAGDFVRFADGLKCHWNITKDIRKHYRFL